MKAIAKQTHTFLQIQLFIVGALLIHLQIVWFAISLSRIYYYFMWQRGENEKEGVWVSGWERGRDRWCGEVMLRCEIDIIARVQLQ